MSSKPRLLDQLRLASPCTASWDEMEGDEQVRFCTKCRLNVYNLAAMSSDEATKLVSAHEGRLCARFYRRADGTVLTRDCPVGLADLRQRAVRAWAAAMAVALFLIGNVAGAVGAYHALGWIPGLKRFQRNNNPWEPSAARNAMRPLLGLPKEERVEILLGDVCLPPLPTPQPPSSPTP
jgi:hypothetical protein